MIGWRPERYLGSRPSAVRCPLHISDYGRFWRRDKLEKLDPGNTCVWYLARGECSVIAYVREVLCIHQYSRVGEGGEERTLSRWTSGKVPGNPADTATLILPAFFGDPKDRYVPMLRRLRRLYRQHRHTTTLRVLYYFCLNEYLKGGRTVTVEAIQEVIAATADLAYQIRIPSSSEEETKANLIR